jgi:hypothetical protein
MGRVVVPVVEALACSLAVAGILDLDRNVTTGGCAGEERQYEQQREVGKLVHGGGVAGDFVSQNVFDLGFCGSNSSRYIRPIFDESGKSPWPKQELPWLFHRVDQKRSCRRHRIFNDLGLARPALRKCGQPKKSKFENI